jgi:RNA polymerase sigma-70 factor (ECF subfamily)
VSGSADADAERDKQFSAEALPWFDDVARFALSLTRDRDEADDLTQETFLRAFRAWHQYTPGTECRRWLFTICRNHFIRERERGKRVTSYDDPEVEALAAASVHASAVQSGWSDLFDRIDLDDAVANALDALPAPFREAVVAVDLEDMAYEAAAEVLGVPIGTVRSRLFRGRRLLQESLLAYAKDAGLAGGRTDSMEEES